MKYIKYGLLLLVVCAFLYGIISNCSRDNTLKKNGICTNAIITNFYNIAKSGYGVEYEFYVNGKKYKESTRLQISNPQNLIGKKVPVIYDKNYPDVNELLWYSSDWEDVGLQFPDSMKWVNDFRER
jgi:hypothetical protein